MPSTIDQWTVVVGILLPLVIAVINRTAWTAPQKACAALLICVVAAGVEVWVKGQWNAQNLGTTAVAIFFVVVTTYKGFWKPTGITDSIEAKTG